MGAALSINACGSGEGEFCIFFCDDVFSIVGFVNVYIKKYSNAQKDAL